MFVLAVKDLAESAKFYQSVLGFQVSEVGDEGWRIFERDNCRIMAGHCPDSMPAKELGDHSYFAYLTLDDVDSFHAELTGKGVEIIKALQSEPWGMREFGVRTNDGHRIMFGQEL